MHEDSIEFSLSRADKGAVGFILAHVRGYLGWCLVSIEGLIY